MIVSDKVIKQYGSALIEPYEEKNVQPASIDCRLARSFRTPKLSDVRVIDLGDPETYKNLTREVGTDEFILHPGEFVLGSTLEKVMMPDNLVARIEGKSSLGRLGLIVHATAGFIDPGFRGNVTLEMTNLLRIPIVLRAGILICQLSFHTMHGEVEHPYRGRYQDAEGAGGSRYDSEGKQLSECCNAEIVNSAPGSGDLSAECSNCGRKA